MRTQPYRGSHLPVLMKVVGLTTGPILELGSGMYSTCYLHWACLPSKRPLVTYESHAQWIAFANQFAADFHAVHYTEPEKWSGLTFEGQWSVALIDHDVPGYLRPESARKLAQAEYVVCHDTENAVIRKYGWHRVFPLFQYRFKYAEAGRPHTTLLSNVHDLTRFTIP